MTTIGYTVDTPFLEATKLYEKRTGTKATIAYIPVEYPIDEATAEVTIIRSRKVSTIILSTEVNFLNPASDNSYLASQRQGKERDYKKRGTKETRGSSDRAARPECPHCKCRITNWDNLGWYWGWWEGTPPYWDELRIHVIRRDRNICQQCLKTLEDADLEVHHIVPKETGGADSALNLTTLCRRCHSELHDHYLEMAESGYYMPGDRMDIITWKRPSVIREEGVIYEVGTNTDERQ